MTPATPLCNVFNYLDYREFLRDCYAARKAANKAFSIRYIAGKAGIDHGTLVRVLQGKRSLDAALSGKLGRIMGLAGEEVDFFETLVLFGKAKSPGEKHQFLEKLVRISGTQVMALERKQSEFYQRWYHQAARELLNFFPCDGDFARLGRMLQPAISAEEARQSVQLLLELGLIAKTSEGKYVQTEQLISSGRVQTMEILDGTHAAMGQLALKSIETVPPAERSFSGLTLSLSPQGLETVRGKLRLFRREILEVARQDEAVNRVYQMNFHVFPLSRPYPTGEAA